MTRLYIGASIASFGGGKKSPPVQVKQSPASIGRRRRMLFFLAALSLSLGQDCCSPFQRAPAAPCCNCMYLVGVLAPPGDVFCWV